MEKIFQKKLRSGDKPQPAGADQVMSPGIDVNWLTRAAGGDFSRLNLQK
jgi:hypothetical protein